MVTLHEDTKCDLELEISNLNDELMRLKSRMERIKKDAEDAATPTRKERLIGILMPGPAQAMAEKRLDSLGFRECTTQCIAEVDQWIGRAKKTDMAIDHLAGSLVEELGHEIDKRRRFARTAVETGRDDSEDLAQIDSAIESKKRKIRLNYNQSKTLKELIQLATNIIKD